LGAAEASLYPTGRAKYWGNVGMEDAPLLCRTRGSVDFTGGWAAPRRPAVNKLVGRWTRQLTLDAGTLPRQGHRRRGVRLWVDDKLILQSWQEGAPARSGRLLFDGKPHAVRVEYYGTRRLAESA